jgi:L-seryl-tRNA(Ser) seleniumtransferase
MSKKDELRKIPSVDKLLSRKKIKSYLEKYPRKLVKECCNILLEELRKDISEGRREKFVLGRFTDDMKQLINKKSKNIKRVINATGIILNTNLGRAPLPHKLVDTISPILTGYSNLEYDLQKGERGKRNAHLVELLKDLTGAEDAFVVNNNAGAVLLCLTTFGKGKEVIVSRGQLVEIGGSYRLPEILNASGAKLVEVGTTNRTNVNDFRAAITPDTKILLLSHRSNFRIVGFTSDPSIEEIVLLGKAKGIMTMLDVGSGLLIDMEKAGLVGEPRVKDVVNKRLDIVTFSGDKLLGGPQAGIILGKKEFITMVRKNPMSRALRIDKFTISALEQVLRIYRYSDNPVSELPGISMAYTSMDDIKKKANSLKRRIRAVAKGNMEVTIEKGFSEMGGGSLPGEHLSTYLVLLSHKKLKDTELLAALRNEEPPVIARIKNNKVALDSRTIFSSELGEIGEAVKRICNKGSN